MASRIAIAAWMLAATASWAQVPPAPAPAPKSLAAAIQVYVFPQEGQSPEVQSQHEAECYNWGVQNTGTDPFALQKQAAQQLQQIEAAKQQAAGAGRGAGARGAVGGAAAGALIGEIASNDAGGGAAAGAAVGLVAGRSRARRGQQQAQSQLAAQEQQVQQATAMQIDNFKKAFSVCLEAKRYQVRY